MRVHQPLRLICNTDSLVANYRWLQSIVCARVGAAVKADAYGTGAIGAVPALMGAGCRDFFVSTWWEAERIRSLTHDASIAVLHGLGPNDSNAARQGLGRPVLNSVSQVARWRQDFVDLECDVMVDTGMNRLGLRCEEVGCLEGLKIHTLHSHLASADEDSDLNRVQLERFRRVAADVAACSYSLANSAGAMLGSQFAFDLIRPGLALYGGIPRPEAREHIHQVVFLEAQVVQRRTIRVGESCGYNATFVAHEDTEAAILNVGYADGYGRSFSGLGSAQYRGVALRVLGRVSMDLVAVDCTDVPDLAEGDWVRIDFQLEQAAEISGKSQYELLTGLGQRLERVWT